jgi:hypothetical protein
MLQTEFPFKLPKGYIDSEGNLHREGIMRLATAKDEIAPLQDPRVQRNRAYLLMILLSRVITQLGDLTIITPTIIENLFSADLAYLQDFYWRINSNGDTEVNITCPSCGHEFRVAESVLNGGYGLEG